LIPHSTSKISSPLSLFTGTKIFAVRDEFCSTIRGSACNPVLLMSTFWPRMLLQIRAGSTLHPFITTTSVEPPRLLDAPCGAHAAIAVDTKRSNTSKLRGISNCAFPNAECATGEGDPTVLREPHAAWRREKR